MYTRVLHRATTLTLLALLAIAFQLTAQDKPDQKPRHHQYKMYDLGTFGGPSSGTSLGAIPLAPKGAIGGADTPMPDPYNPNCFEFDCFVKHAFQWQDGVLSDLGALPGNNGGNSSYGFAINNGGLVAGISENGSIDPATGYPESNAVVWNRGQIINLGTFGGTQSAAEMVNDRGQVVGVATNATPDPFSFGGDPFPATTQSRAFLWERGVMRDLGTLGGPDAFGRYINQSGEVAGWSYTSYTPNPDTGIPTIHPFIWKNGKMTDLGTLGGTIAEAGWINSRGQDAGYSYLAGDNLYHGFLWDRGVLNDLPPVGGGSFSSATWINDAGDVVGSSSIAGDQVFHAPLWTHGKAIDLGVVGQDACSVAYGINEARQIVGASGGSGGQCTAFVTARAYLWENGGPMVDLNALIENPSDLHLYWGIYISDRGEIVTQGILPNGDIHVALLVPHGDCDGDCEQRIVESQKIAVGQPATTSATVSAFGKPADWLRRPLGGRYPMPGQRAVPPN